MYYPEYDFLFLDIFKNGSNLFAKLFVHVFGREHEIAYFKREPQIYMSVVRNPYDRLISQFYHINRQTINKNFKYALHYPFFRKWVKEVYSGEGYTGTDGHLFSQTHIIQYYEFPLDYKIFKMEELIPHKMFYFLDLTDEQKKDIDNKFSELNLELSLNGHHALGNMKQGVWEVFHNAETIELCNRYFAKDFEAFGYDMIEPSKWEAPKKSIL